MFGLAFSDHNRSSQHNSQKAQKEKEVKRRVAAAVAAHNSSASVQCSSSSAAKGRTRRRRKGQKSIPTSSSQSSNRTSSQSSNSQSSSRTKVAPVGRKASQVHDVPLTKGDLYLAVRCGMVEVSTGKNSKNSTTKVGRVTVLNWDNQVVMDDFVKVPMAVIDYRTDITGITPQAITSAETLSYEEVRTKVGALVTGKILVGHGLEVDLAALGLSHPWCDVRDIARYAPYMQEVSDPLSTMLLPRNLDSLIDEVLGDDAEDDDVEPGPISEAFGCMNLYKLAREEWEHEVRKLVQQKEKQIEMVKNMRASRPPPTTSLKPSPSPQLRDPEITTRQLSQAKPKRWDGGEEELTLDTSSLTLLSAEPAATMNYHAHTDDGSVVSVYSRESWAASSISSMSRASSHQKPRIENMREFLSGARLPAIPSTFREQEEVWKSSSISVGSSYFSTGEDPETIETRTVWSNARSEDWSQPSRSRTEVFLEERMEASPRNSINMSAMTEEEARSHLPTQLLADLDDTEGEDQLQNLKNASVDNPSSPSTWFPFLKGKNPTSLSSPKHNLSSSERSRRSKDSDRSDSLFSAETRRRSNEKSTLEASASESQQTWLEEDDSDPPEYEQSAKFSLFGQRSFALSSPHGADSREDERWLEEVVREATTSEQS